VSISNSYHVDVERFLRKILLVYLLSIQIMKCFTSMVLVALLLSMTSSCALIQLPLSLVRQVISTASALSLTDEAPQPEKGLEVEQIEKIVFSIWILVSVSCIRNHPHSTWHLRGFLRRRPSSPHSRMRRCSLGVYFDN